MAISKRTLRRLANQPTGWVRKRSRATANRGCRSANASGGLARTVWLRNNLLGFWLMRLRVLGGEMTYRKPAQGEPQRCDVCGSPANCMENGYYLMVDCSRCG